MYLRQDVNGSLWRRLRLGLENLVGFEHGLSTSRERRPNLPRRFGSTSPDACHQSAPAEFRQVAPAGVRSAEITKAQRQDMVTLKNDELRFGEG
jgi:hypothetical protein